MERQQPDCARYVKDRLFDTEPIRHLARQKGGRAGADIARKWLAVEISLFARMAPLSSGARAADAGWQKQQDAVGLMPFRADTQAQGASLPEMPIFLVDYSFIKK